MMPANNQRLVNLNDGIRLLVTDHGHMDYGNRFTAEVYSADGIHCGSLGGGSDNSGGATLNSTDNVLEDRAEHFAAEFDKCILKALAAAAK